MTFFENWKFWTVELASETLYITRCLNHRISVSFAARRDIQGPSELGPRWWFLIKSGLECRPLESPSPGSSCTPYCLLLRILLLNQRLAKFFWKGPDSISQALHANDCYWLPVSHESIPREYLNKWVWLCSSNVSFTNPVVGLIWPGGLWFADPCIFIIGVLVISPWWSPKDYWVLNS